MGETGETIYRTSKRFRTTCTIAGVICAVTVVFLPFAVMMFWLGYGAQVRIRDDKLVIRWFGTREVPWGDISGMKWLPAVGLVGGLMRPLTYQLRSKPNAAPRLAVGTYESGDAILAELTRRTGAAVAPA